MRLLLDQGLPRGTAAYLRERQVDCVHAGECGLAKASDQDILQSARRTGRVVVTLDADFHALMALSNAAAPSVIRIRIEGLRADALAALLLSLIDQCKADLIQGSLVSVTKNHVRVHHLPIGARQQ